MWFVYILLSKDHRILYVGSTNDLQRRLAEHNGGQCLSTKAYAPLKIAGYIGVTTETRARKLEQYFKTGSGRTVLKKRILDDEDLANHEVMSET